ncbi:hypothetical protein M8W91_002809 [Salmonella enterica]|nr:hypothetical protein [Salmonella enterica]EJF5856684.1 hypothetical protein [Salmonella enterica]EJF5948049.1 hypothetical protein [Salmonella enterica]EJF6158034.1 hypothetical protein [Salmonella enterica]EJF6377314.1 hypothetical protein [Salmonella enterica]
MPDVTLTAPHTHEGVRFKAGDTITVTPAEAQWLEAHQVIAPDAIVQINEESEHE